LKNDTEEKRKLLEEVEQLKKEEQEVKKQIAKFSSVDPEAIAEMDKKAQVQSNSIYVIDNIYQIYFIKYRSLNLIFNVSFVL